MKKYIMICAAILSSAAMVEDDALAQFNEVVKAAEKDREHDKSPQFDRHYKPIIDGLTSSHAAVLQRARELMYPLLRDGWIAVDQFDFIGWNNFDAVGRGMYLWCAAARCTWGGNKELGYPLKPEITVKLWTAAAQEPIALPYLKEAAVTWYGLRHGNSAPIRLGDSLGTEDRKKVSGQYISLLNDCKNDQERVAVAWMIVDLQGPEDMTLQNWYETQANPVVRRLMLESLSQILRQPAIDDFLQKSILAQSKQSLDKRLPMLKALVTLASKDWDELAAKKAMELRVIIDQMGLTF